MRQGNHIDALTGLRGIAALWVLIFHAFACHGFFGPLDFLTAAGYLGVDVFFILSGFVLALNYGGTSIAYGTFLSKRLARIYPAHAFVLLCMLGAGTIAMLAGLNLSVPMFQPRGFIESLLLIQAWHWTLRFVWNGPSWSVSAEWAAYLLFPMIAWAAARLRSQQQILLAIVLCFALLYCAPGLDKDHYSLVDQGTRLFGEFTAGVLAQRLLLLRGPDPRADTLAFVSLALLFFGSNLMDTLSWIGASSCRMEATACATVYWLAAARGPVSKALSSAAMLYLGRISYAIYLVHFSWLLASDYVIEKYWDERWLIRLAALCATLCSAHLLHRYIEEPARLWLTRVAEGRRTSRQVPATVPPGRMTKHHRA